MRFALHPPCCCLCSGKPQILCSHVWHPGCVCEGLASLTSSAGQHPPPFLGHSGAEVTDCRGKGKMLCACCAWASFGREGTNGLCSSLAVSGAAQTLARCCGKQRGTLRVTGPLLRAGPRPSPVSRPAPARTAGSGAGGSAECRLPAAWPVRKPRWPRHGERDSPKASGALSVQGAPLPAR